MKKNLGIMVLAAAMTVCTTTSAYAEIENEKIVDMAIPRYKDIMEIVYSFRITSSGKAVYSADVITASSEKISCYMELQYKRNGDWEKVRGVKITEHGDVGNFADHEYVTESGVYRVYYEIEAFYGEGQSEVVEEYYYDDYKN